MIPKLIPNTNINWDSFREFLAGNCRDKVVKDRIRYAKKFSHCLLNRDFSEFGTFSETRKEHILKALSGLAKFLGMYEDFKALIKAYGLKWRSSNAEDLIISRMIKATENNNVLEWIREVKAKLPQLNDFMDFVLVSGLRFEEAINSYNLIIGLAKEGRLNDYYNAEKETLEHYRFKNLFIRRTKKVFVTFIPKTFVERISNQKQLTRFQIDNWIKRKGFKSRFSDIREYFATYMTKQLSQAEIDFLQGRVCASVFMRNYFTPALIKDLKQRTFKATRKIENSIKA